MSDVNVTYEGPTPAGAPSSAVQIEDKTGKTHLFEQGITQTVDSSVAKLAENLDHHKFNVEPVKAKGADS